MDLDQAEVEAEVDVVFVAVRRAGRPLVGQGHRCASDRPAPPERALPSVRLEDSGTVLALECARPRTRAGRPVHRTVEVHLT